MHLRALIVDDEAPARSRLRKLLAAFPDVEVAGEAADGLEAVAAIERLRPDVVFLDVQMPGLGGFEVVAALPRAGHMPLVVFATAYDAYALEAFEANAVAYLLKPFKRERLAAAVERVRRLVESGSARDEAGRVRRVAEGASRPGHVVCRRRDRYVLVPVDRVVHVSVEDGVARVHTDEGAYRTDLQIGALAARLPDPPFFRAHRATIVNMRRVREVAPYFNGTYLLVLDDPAATEVRTSERQSKVLREMLRG
jgi:two-component system LytT family response regulator